MGQPKDTKEQSERRREALRRILQANGYNITTYAMVIGVRKETVTKMLNGDCRVSDRVLGLGV